MSSAYSDFVNLEPKSLLDFIRIFLMIDQKKQTINCEVRVRANYSDSL